MRVAVTGGSGSLGRELITQLAAEGADRIVTMSRDEAKRSALQREFSWHRGVKVYAGDIRDRERLTDVFKGCEVVVHAAARKVVSGNWDEAQEMHKTNVLGTLNVMSAAREAGIDKLLFVSSDKAVRPENVYGVSKALAEHMVIAENARTYHAGLRMSVIRYGNVLGSNGSVVLHWQKAKADGQPLRLSDRRMTRFWLRISDAAKLVRQAVSDMRGGEVFVPSLKAAPLVDLAEAIYPNATVVDMGIRSGGEKLHEELLSADEIRRTVMRNGFFVVTPGGSEENAWDPRPWLGKPLCVSVDWRYRSDIWNLRWTVDELRGLLENPR